MNTVLYKIARADLIVLAAWYTCAPLLGWLNGWQEMAYYIAGTPLVFGVRWLGDGAVYFYKWQRRRLIDGKTEIIWDEREEAVFYKALAWGFGSSWITLVLAVGWFIRRYLAPGPEEITMVSLSVILGICFAVLVLFFSLSVVLQKRGEGAADE